MHSENEKIFAVVFIAASLLGFVVIYFIYTFVKQQRKILKWQQARIAAEIETLEKERKRIAEDLHDEVGPMLSAIKLQINHLEPTDEFEQTILGKSSNQIDFIIEKFREISYNLLPNTLIRKGLVPAVIEYIYKMQTASGLKIEFTQNNMKKLPEQIELNVYRIIQEIVHNAVKHSRASFIKIKLQINEGGALSLTTEDNGIGFIYKEEANKNNGLGLLNLSSRVEVLQGNLNITTALGLGTKYSIRIPI